MDTHSSLKKKKKKLECVNERAVVYSSAVKIVTLIRNVSLNVLG